MPTTGALPQVLFAERFASAEPVPFHHHDCLELVLVTRGRCVIHIGDTALTGKRGDAFLLPARVPHDQVGNGVVSTLYVGFHPGSDGLDETPAVVHAGADKHVRGWTESLVALHAESDASPTVLGSLLSALLSRLRQIQHHTSHALTVHPKIAAAILFIRERVTESLTVTRIAQAVDLSPSHLTALFREHVGYPPRIYQRQLRMALARRRLLDPYRSVKQVAAECGYRDPNLFIRIFRQQHQVAPGGWRQSALAPKPSPGRFQTRT